MPLAPPQGRLGQPRGFAPQGKARGPWPGQGDPSSSPTPLTILGSSLKGWWDFSDLSTLFQLSNGTTAVTADADRIGYATDKSGTGTHVIQASANLRGTYKASIQNGRGVCRFDGSDDFLAADLVQAQPFSVFLVFKIITLSGTEVVMGGKDGTEGAVVYRSAANKFRVYFGTDQDIDDDDSNFHVLSFSINGASSHCHLDGADVTLAGSPGAQTLTKIALGAYQDGTNPCVCDVGESIISTGASTHEQITSMESYLNSRWAVY